MGSNPTKAPQIESDIWNRLETPVPFRGPMKWSGLKRMVETANQKKIELGELVENDYNPRGSIKAEDVESLVESIEENNFNTALTVREVDGGYEVVAGERRLKALQQAVGDDFGVPCIVEDYNDREAKIAAITENLEREDLTPVQEAWGYAELVEIEHEGETISYKGYIKENYRVERAVSVPHHSNSAIGTVSKEIGVGQSEISRRLKLLTLPEELQESVSSGDLVKDAATSIARLRNIPEPEIREKKMLELGEIYRGDNPDIDRLRKEVGNLLEEAEERQKEEEEEVDSDEEKIKALEYEVAEAEQDLQVPLENAISHYEDAMDMGIDFEGASETHEKAEVAIRELNRAKSHFNSLYMDESNEELSSLETERRRKAKAFDNLQDQSEAFCPHCGEEVDIDRLEEEIDGLDEEIERVEEEKLSYSNTADNLGEKSSELLSLKQDYDQAVETLEEIKE